MTKIYNKSDDEQFYNVISSLKQLPKVDAPPDFEMNLKRRINQLQYEKKRGFIYYFSLKRPLIPAAALTIVVIITLMLTNRTTQPGNPFTTVPALRTDSGQAVVGGKVKSQVIKPENISANDVVIKKSAPQQSSAAKKQTETITPKPQAAEDKQIAASRRSAPRQLQLDFGQFDNDLDKSMRAKPDPNGGGINQSDPDGSSNVNFGGFNYVPEYDQNLDLLRARIDSLKRLKHR